MVCSVLLACLTLVDVFKGIQERTNGITVPPVNFVSSLILVLTLAFTVFLINYERIHGLRSSAYLFIFWFLLALFEIVTFRSKIRVALIEGGVTDVARFVAFYIFYPIVLVQVVLAALVDLEPATYEVERDENPCPERSASFLSRITFWWFTGLVIKGFKNPLERSSLWSLNPDDKSSSVVPQFTVEWDKELRKAKCGRYKISKEGQSDGKGADKETRTRYEDGTVYTEVTVVDGQKKKEPSLFMALTRAFGTVGVIAGLFKLMHDILIFVSPYLLKLMIQFTNDKSIPTWKGYLYAALMVIIALIQSLVLHQYFHGCFLLGMRLRTAIIAAVYNKALLLSNSARKSSTVGEIVNLMSVDAQRFMDLMTYIHMLWSAPFQIAVSLYFLWQTLGPSVLAGLGVMILLIPVNAVIANKTKQLQVKQMTLKDERIKLMNEILNGIKVLKLYAWEGSFQERVLGIRNKELVELRKAAYLNAGTSFTWVCAPFLVSLITFAVYVLSSPENVLDAEKAFVSLSLFNILRFPLSMLPQLISNMVQTSVSMKRLRVFLSNDELDPDAVQTNPEAKHAIEVKKGTFTWDKDGDPILKSIDLMVPQGSLVAVVGAVGSGKSSLLSALLGDMEKISGSVNVKGSVAYVPQQAWIQNATLKNNILFGKSLQDCDYYKVIDACALKSDFEMLPASDQTEIGEKGINLSGGQKQRVSLARAVYQDTDLYLLDDPLSAVDSHVGKHIFEQVIGPDGVLKGKTRILVTHGIGYLPQVDQIIVLVDGQISEVGSYKELMDHAGAFADFLKNYLTSEEDLEEEILDPEDPVSNMEAATLREEILSHLGSIMEDEGSKQLINRQISRVRTQTENSEEKPVSRTASQASKLNSTSQLSLNKVVDVDGKTCKPPSWYKGPEEQDKLIQKEVSMTGRVKLAVFLAYFKAIGLPVSCLIVLFYVLNNAASIYSNIWLSEWSNDASQNATMGTEQRDMRLGVYGALGLLQGIFVLLGALLIYRGNIRAGRVLHCDLLTNVLASPMSFFDTTPLGRTINRFGKDLDVVDVTLPMIFRSWLACVLKVVAVLLVISISTPPFVAVILPLALIYFLVQRFYVATSRQLKRLESVSRSPIYSHFGETITGAPTIRAYRQQKRFMEESEARVDENQICYYPSIVSNRWLAIRLEFVGNCIVFFASLFAVIQRDSLEPGTVGLSITYALSITQTLNWMVRMTSELETNIVAVERVKEYSETPTEADWVIENNRPGAKWPEEGTVEFENYCVRYREGLDLVLKGIDCKITPGEKIGIVGRTGAGKSSLTLALFRIIEAAGGSIIIDGINISKIGLHDLRSKITIIPQDPVLFAGTLRMNLDPFDAHTDDDVWKSLEHAHLKNFVSLLPEGLLYKCTEGGENLSVGQRQLVCLARALLRKTKILVLDEATAAVDLETDDLIQATIRTEFADCTVLTIAHRLNTIMDYTRIMVLDAGRVKEFDNPQTLLQDNSSVFYGMAKDANLVA
ncbi:multidrug resistance-associated protein 1-like isoform X1 [Liolophura sinensis]|uniref:multidrug resistance-associated protein 1-like isoform X1 n=1 Tax=Liolophura sinensis TaxID=3198878 RepID=UPI0031596273